MCVKETLLAGHAILRFSFQTPTCDQLVLSAYSVACYQFKPDVLLKKPLVAWCFHTDILGGGPFSGYNFKNCCVRVWGMTVQMRRQKVVQRFGFVR